MMFYVFRKIPDTYSVMFLQGGGTGLFAAVAMNLMSRTGTADYVVTGERVPLIKIAPFAYVMLTRIEFSY